MSHVSPRITGAATSSHTRLVRFGNFEVNLGTGELRKSGIKIKLYGQPFEVLALLLERPGEMVTREELQQKLWDSSTCVDFEHGLNKTISRLRETLADVADSPRYIETVPRRGYRFVGPVTRSFTPTPAAEEPVPSTTAEPGRGQPRAKTNRRYAWIAALAAATVCALLAASYFWIRASSSVPRVVRYRQLTTDRKDKEKPCGSAVRSRVVSDGARVFFSEVGFGLKQVSTKGGDVGDVANPLGCFNIFDISPDKTELLGAAVVNPIAEDIPLWALSVVNGLAHRIGNLNGHAAAWSHDGQRIAYVTGSVWRPPNDVYIAAKDGSQELKLAHIDAGAVTSILWSPDDRTLTLGVTSESHGSSLWEVSIDGSNLHLSRELPQQASCCWKGMTYGPEGKYFVAQAGASLWAVRAGPTGFLGRPAEPIQLTSGPISYQNPALGPDGETIFAVGGRARGELLRYDLNSKRLEPFLSGISAEQLGFSRDGVWVAYVTYPEGVLWRSRVDGSERMQLTNPPLYAFEPRWSPDGKRIAFSGVIDGGYAKLYVMSADGGTPEMIPQSQNAEAEVDSSWTPDGNSLVYGGSMWSEVPPSISSIDLRTGRSFTIPGSEGMESPRLSPDGRFIYAEKSRERKSFLFEARSQRWSEIPAKLTSPIWPEWSSDSKYVYLGHDSEMPAGSYHEIRVRAADSMTEPVATMSLPDGLTGVWGGWMSTAPDGSPLLLRDLSIQEIYALDLDKL
jgi:Tol biopolymer transport system component/DNA-binding winged helix-turn-helix (wHTH) protein